jgi:four helix bundle protein
MAGSYKELKVWQMGMELVFMIYGLTSKFPKDELYGLISQMRRAAVSIVSNIAEGKGRTGKKELAHFLSNSRGALHELETQVLVADRLKYFGSVEEKELLSRIAEIGRMLTGLMKFAENQTP